VRSILKEIVVSLILGADITTLFGP
jgi:hypothetical protein